MSQVLLELEQKAAQLPDAERAQLARFLLKSLGSPNSPNSLDSLDAGDIEDAWRIEAESRLAEIERGEAQWLPAADVFENLHRRLA